MKKIKIIEATVELGLGGTEYVIQLYSKYLNKEHFEVTVVGLNGGGERVKFIEKYGVRVLILGGDYTRLATLLSETDVFHWHGAGIMDAQLLATVQANKPKLVIQTNIFGLYYHSPTYDLIDYDLYVSKMILIRRMKEDRYFNMDFRKKRKALYNPVDVDAMNDHLPTEDELQQFKKEHQLDGYFIIGRIGRADDNKFDPISLYAFAEFVNRVKNARFLIVGVTPKILNYAKALNILDKLVVFENTPDLKQLLLYYSAIDIFLAASSMGESFGIVIAEAMNSGIPVVTINTPDRDNAQIELVDNGVTGLVVERHSTKIADALTFLYQNNELRYKFGIAAQAKVLREYKADQIVASLENLIYRHLQVPYQNKIESLLKDFNIKNLYDYTKRRRNLWNTYG